MDNCCRICRRNELKDSFSLNYQSDFHSKTRETVLDMLNIMTGLNVSLGDTLPQQLCRVCTGTLVAGYELRNLSIESDAFFRRTLPTDVQKESDQTNHNDLESCLTFEEIKLEPSLELDNDMKTDFVETDLECNLQGSADRFYCCFPKCNDSYQFEELLTEHAESYHQLEKEANSSNSNHYQFRCQVCSRGFADEIDLLQHRKHERTTLQSDSHISRGKATYNKKKNVCACGFRTIKTFAFKRHQAICAQPKLYASLLDDVPDTDKTNDEIIAMGFSLNRNTTMFYCCIPQCATVCETQQQLCDHFHQDHPKVREENMQTNSNWKNVFRCLVCCTGFPTEKKLQLHLEDAYDPTFRCKTCRYSSLTRKNAVIHALVPCGDKDHRCSCGYSTPYTSAIKRHMRTMGCPIEGSSLRNYRIRPPRNTEKRAEKDTSGSEMSYKCQNCQKFFSSTTSLRRHTESELSRALTEQEAKDPGRMVEGSTQKQYTCWWCKAITDDCNHLVQCMIKAERDTGENIGYKCSNCRKKFKKYNKYLDHLKSKVCLL